MNNKEKTSESKFYVIDLQAMKGISLNYGRDYENVKNTNTQKANEYTDIYVINNITHNIFYIKGISTEENDVDSGARSQFRKLFIIEPPNI